MITFSIAFWSVARIGVLVALASCLVTLPGTPPAQAQQPQPLRKLTVLMVPTVPNDSMWMAETKGYFKEMGLQVDVKFFPSGTTALQSFKAGVGEITLAGELPGVAYWQNSQKDYRIINVMHREAVIYGATALKTIKSAEDLRGKTIGTRVGSTGSWFISEYLKKHNIPESAVKIIDLDTQILPVALCRGDIDAFFIWHPAGARALEICPQKVHMLATGEGYINGYGMLGARASWLAKPENGKLVADFLKALSKGREYAEKHYDEVFAYVKEKWGYNDELAKYGWQNTERYFGFDKVFYRDFCQLSAWMVERKMLPGPLDFRELVYKDGLAAVDPSFVSLPSDKCPG
jgi:ABC-type nitrate/sulfonate/bicarbonate transport system substrate-binding protein